MTVEIILRSIFTKVWHPVRVQTSAPGSADVSLPTALLGLIFNDLDEKNEYEQRSGNQG